MKCPGFTRFHQVSYSPKVGFFSSFSGAWSWTWGPGRVGAVGYSEEDDESELSELSESSESESESELSDEDDEDDEDSSCGVGNAATVQLKLWPLKPSSHTPDLASTALSSAASQQADSGCAELGPVKKNRIHSSSLCGSLELHTYSFGLILYLIKIH